MLAEEFFGLFELVHGLQQDGQVVDAPHGMRVLVPQLEAPCKPSLKEKRNHRLFLKAPGCNSAAGPSPNRIHCSCYVVFLLLYAGG